MFDRFRAWRKARALRRTQAHRALALAALDVAIKRSDTRAIGATYPVARQATLAELAATIDRQWGV